MAALAGGAGLGWHRTRQWTGGQVRRCLQPGNLATQRPLRGPDQQREPDQCGSDHLQFMGVMNFMGSGKSRK